MRLLESSSSNVNGVPLCSPVAHWQSHIDNLLLLQLKVDMIKIFILIERILDVFFLPIISPPGYKPQPIIGPPKNPYEIV